MRSAGWSSARDLGPDWRAISRPRYQVRSTNKSMTFVYNDPLCSVFHVATIRRSWTQIQKRSLARSDKCRCLWLQSKLEAQAERRHGMAWSHKLPLASVAPSTIELRDSIHRLGTICSVCGSSWEGACTRERTGVVESHGSFGNIEERDTMKRARFEKFNMWTDWRREILGVGIFLFILRLRQRLCDIQYHSCEHYSSSVHARGL
jgi:hypothetical protein